MADPLDDMRAIVVLQSEIAKLRSMLRELAGRYHGDAGCPVSGFTERVGIVACHACAALEECGNV